MLYDDLKTNTGDLIEKGNYLNQLNFAAVGCPSIQQSIETTRFSEITLTRIVEKINQCQAPGTASTVYYQKPKSETRIYGYAGGLPLGEQYEYTGQVLVRFILPTQSKKTSLNTGIIYSKTRGEDPKYDFLETDVVLIPVTIQHNLTTGIVQPYIYAGLGAVYRRENTDESQTGLQRSWGVSPVLGAGVDVYITKRLIARADMRYDIFLHFPTVGIAYRFK